jgi:adenylylsulfate kinase-like enzyme
MKEPTFTKVAPYAQPTALHTNGIRIEIAGRAGVGKTTVGVLIAKALAAAGFDVELIDYEVIRPASDYERKLAAIVDRSPHVQISTRQLPRSE